MGQPAPPKDDSEDDESDPGMTEMRFVPDDKAMLDAMFHAMTQCQALHPDPEDSASDDDIFEDADEDEEEGGYHLGSGDAPVILSTEQGQRETANGNPQDEPMEMDGQFEDADG
uniref:Methylosome subunit pICln n=1 Tax=Timema douglasi TaxID=61478 RepID=A0A7R8Z861_TIMDO|nr:unnamed protein product [Timema douglasi]